MIFVVIAELEELENKELAKATELQASLDRGELGWIDMVLTHGILEPISHALQILFEPTIPIQPREN